jgi:DNA-damage-inducible protein J
MTAERGDIMPDTTNLNIVIDKELKERAEVFFGEMGLTMTGAFNIFVRQSMRQGKIPFEISVATPPDPFYGPENMKALRQAMQEISEGKVVTKTLDELKAMER